MVGFREFSVDHLPEFHPSIVPKDQVWTIAYVPGDKYVIEMVMDDAKTVLNQEAKTKLEQQCNFGKNTEESDIAYIFKKIICNKFYNISIFLYIYLFY